MSLSITAPSGAHFEYEEVSTERGTKVLGQVPMLVWDSADAAIKFYGETAIIDVLDGTSLRVSFQGIARRLKVAGKSDDEIAQKQIEFRPGKRGGNSTPASRAKAKVSEAVEKLNDPSKLERVLAKIASGEIDEAELEALGS